MADFSHNPEAMRKCKAGEVTWPPPGAEERTFDRHGMSVTELVWWSWEGKTARVLWVRNPHAKLILEGEGMGPAGKPNPCFHSDFSAMNGKVGLELSRRNVAADFDAYWAGDMPFVYADRNEKGEWVRAT